MITARHTQTLSDFRNNADETLERLNQTGDAEIITVNGEVRAVLLAPGAYAELAGAWKAEIEADVTAILRSRREFEEGKGQDVRIAFAQLREELSSIKPAQKAAG
jgi:PHD/YefM family antitoxin component YafN of YafNO toxin-antitoxin module